MKKLPDIDKLLALSISEIQEQVKKIKYNLSSEERKIITFSKNYTLSLSNYCQNECGYCYYNYKIPKEEEEENVVLLSKEEIENKTERALKYGCKEALIMSGENPGIFPEVKNLLNDNGFDNYLNYVQNICHYLLKVNMLPHTNIGFLDLKEMKSLKKCSSSMGLMLESSSEELSKKGRVHEKSPGKLPSKRIKHIKTAGKLKIPFTTGLLLGIGETRRDRINDLLLIKNINDRYGHIQEVIIQNFVRKPYIQYQPSKTISIKEMLRVVGLAKLIFKNEIAVQVPPNLIAGYEKQFLNMGIDDFGGISPFTIDYINPENRWPEIKRLETICKKNGFILKERLPIYEKYIDNESFCPENIQKIIRNIRGNVVKRSL